MTDADEASGTHHEELSQLLRERRRQLSEYVAKHGNDRPDQPYRPGHETTRVAVLALLACCGMVSAIVFAPGWWRICGGLGLLMTILLALPAIRHGLGRPTSDPAEIQDPILYLRAFIYFVSHGHDRVAFRMLSPWARQRSRAKLAPFKEMPMEFDADEITDHESLGDYWRGFLCSGDEAVRSATLENLCVTVRSKGGSLALVEGTIVVRYLPQTEPGPLTSIRLKMKGKEECLQLRKLLLRCHNQWYLAESEFCGELDRLGSEKETEDSGPIETEHWSKGTWD